MKTTEDDVVELVISRKAAVAAFGALSLVCRQSDDQDLQACMREFMKALADAQVITPG